MKKITWTILLLSASGLVACAPYAPGDCRYDNTCRDHPYNQNYNNQNYPNPNHPHPNNTRHEGRYDERVPAGYIDAHGNRFWLSPDGYYYRDQGYSGPRYYYRDGYYYVDAPPPPPSTPPGGWHRPTQKENHPDKY